MNDVEECAKNWALPSRMLRIPRTHGQSSHGHTDTWTHGHKDTRDTGHGTWTRTRTRTRTPTPDTAAATNAEQKKKNYQSAVAGKAGDPSTAAEKTPERKSPVEEKKKRCWGLETILLI